MIKYLPNLDSGLWSRKCIRTFDTIEDLKHYIARKITRNCRYIGEDKMYHADDVELETAGHDPIMGWTNYCSIILDGRLIGFCGE